MTIPNLLNPVDITVSRIDKSETQYDPITRENINIIRRRPDFDIKAQLVFRKVFTGGSFEGRDLDGSMNEGIGGAVPESDGYVLLREVDMKLKGLTFNDIVYGDKITKMGQLENLEYFVTGKRPAAHYADQGGFQLLAVFFETRNP